MENGKHNFDFIVIGSGMGGLAAGSLLANDGYRVLILEASHAVGGCSSSYYRKGFVFESGATTLIGFDEHQPLRELENRLGIEIPKEPLQVPMQVHLNGRTITRYRERQKWIEEAVWHFGEEASQKSFWELAFRTSDLVWRVSSKNPFFPPVEAADWLRLLKNDPRDLRALPYALKSVRKVASGMGLTNPDFFRFLDEQLMISSQAPSAQTPFLFGAPAITYTHSTNYYVPGGLLKMSETLRDVVTDRGGEVRTKERVLYLEKREGQYVVHTSKKRTYHAPQVISNLPVWNMPELTGGVMREWFSKEAARYDHAWGAFTMGVVTDDPYPDGMVQHHQVHLPEGEKIPGIDSDSIFVSFSMRGDYERAPEGKRVLNISTHTEPGFWFGLNGEYEAFKESVQNRILTLLRERLPGFSDASVELAFSATPVSWSNWVYRKKGRVGGIPQSMSRSLLDWTPNKTPFRGLWMCGDTVFPGQGIPGVTLSAINVYYRVQNQLKKDNFP